MSERNIESRQSGAVAQQEACTDTCIAQVPIETVVGRIAEVSTLPHVALKVMEVANDPASGAAELRGAVEGDAALSARVLRTVNSSAYALRSKITNLQQAISYLGFSQIRNLAITASVSDSFKRDEAIGFYRRSSLWRHLVAVGICSRLIAARQKLPNFEDAYLAGLLHDFGIILEDQHASTAFKTMIQSLDMGKPLIEAEQAYLGFDHTQLGSRVADAWKFPPAARAAIRFHHMSGNCRDDEAPIVRCVEVANFICSVKGIPSIGVNLVQPPHDAIAALSFRKEDIKILVTDLDNEMIRHESLFTL